jgi:hypothetical protein
MSSLAASRSTGLARGAGGIFMIPLVFDAVRAGYNIATNAFLSNCYQIITLLSSYQMLKWSRTYPRRPRPSYNYW